MINMGKGYYFDTELHEVLKNQESILNIRGIRGSLLEILLENSRNKYLTKDELIERAWGKSALVVGSNSLTQQVYLLRKSLNSIGMYNYILSRSRSGYKISKNAFNDKTINL